MPRSTVDVMRCARGGLLLGRDLALGSLAGEILGNRLERAVQETLFHVVESHRIAGAREHVRDAVAHRACADNADLLDLHEQPLR